MQTIIVQITNPNGLRLLEDLEKLHIIKLLKRSITPGEKLSERFAGKLSKQMADKIQQDIQESRNEWDSNNS